MAVARLEALSSKVPKILILNRKLSGKTPLIDGAKVLARAKLAVAIKDVADEAIAYLREKASANKKLNLSANEVAHSFDHRRQIAIDLNDSSGNHHIGKVADLEISLHGFKLYDASGVFHGKKEWSEFPAAIKVLGEQIENLDKVKRLC
ncbi:MAG: hypothetical protein NTV88_01320 [Candidatus Micrarchaeota archaeon]|nr:hypothetical protein [Candidatus Micrarchaeota archaeon]